MARRVAWSRDRGDRVGHSAGWLAHGTATRLLWLWLRRCRSRCQSTQNWPRTARILTGSWRPLLSPFEPPAALLPQSVEERRHLGRRHHHLRRHDQHFRRQRAPPTRTARSSNMYPAGIPCCYRPRFHRYRPTERTAPHRTDRRTDRRAQGSTLAHQCPSPQCLGLISGPLSMAHQHLPTTIFCPRWSPKTGRGTTRMDIQMGYKGFPCPQHLSSTTRP